MNPLELVTAYQQSAVVAAGCGTDPRATRALLGGLAALGLADHGPGGYALSADGAVLASDHPGSVALIVAKEWFFYQAWAGLPESVRDGHARIAPWRNRLAGDPGRPRFGRPAGERWDAVLLANILHDHPADRCQAMVTTAAGLLAPGGTLLLYEWVLDEPGDSPPAVALFDLMMLVENEGGAARTAAQLTAWLQVAGLTAIELHRGTGPIAVLRAARMRT